MAGREGEWKRKREQDQLAAAIRAEIEVERVWEAQPPRAVRWLPLRMKPWPITGPVVPSRSTLTSSELQDV